MNSKIQMDWNGLKEKMSEKGHALLLQTKNKVVSLISWLKSVFLQPGEGRKTFYLLTLVAVLCFVYTLRHERCTIPLSGDYSRQERNFIFNGYDDWHYFFRTGVFPQWDRSAFLGIDNIGGNSFYYLFDPFVLILLPFPREWLQTLQGLEFIPKMVLAGRFFYWYLGDLGFSPKNRRIGALAFAFSSYSFGYLWFHFIDSVAFLPLIFLGLERIIKKRDPRIFLVGFFLNARASYFFFAVFRVGAFLYARFRFFQTRKERTKDENYAVMGCGRLSFILALCLGAFTLLPGLAVAKSRPRTQSNSYLDAIKNADGLKNRLKAVFTFPSGREQNQYTPLFNFLFMSDSCYSSNLMNVNWYDNCQAGLYATTPMLLRFFVSFMDSMKEKKVSHLLGRLGTLFLIFTPIGFYLFSGFTVAYARYFILPVSWRIVFDLKAIEKRRELPRSYLDLAAIFTLSLQAICCFLVIYGVSRKPGSYTGTEWDLKRWLIFGSLIWTRIVYLITRPFFHKKQYSYVTIGRMSLDIIVRANLTIYGQGLSKSNQSKDIPLQTEIITRLKQEENGEDYFRIFSDSQDRNTPNISRHFGYSGTSSFHSVYPYGAQEFIDRSRIPYNYKSWLMGLTNRRENRETFLGVKYYRVDRIQESSRKDSRGRFVSYDGTKLANSYDIPYGFKNVLDLTSEEEEEIGIHYSDSFKKYLSSKDCNKSLYVNLNFIDLGFGYDNVIDSSWMATNLGYKNDDDDLYFGLSEDINEYPLLRAASLEHEDFLNLYYKNQSWMGKFYGNGKEIYSYKELDSRDKTNQARNATSFQGSLTVTGGNYTYGSSAPIEYYSGNYNRHRIATVFSANWPEDKGGYAYCSLDNPSDQTCRSEYAKTHPFENANGITPADTVFDLDTLKDKNGNKHSASVLYYSKILLQFTNSKGEYVPLAPEADPRNPTTGSYIGINSDKNIEWRLFDKDDHRISYNYPYYSSYQTAHGYYTDRPVYKILGRVKGGSVDSPTVLKKPNIYVIRNRDYQDAMDNLKKNKIHIVSRNENEVLFNTDYDEKKFVVLNRPLQNGWKLYQLSTDEDTGETVKEEVDTYKAQGGFIGFLASNGKAEYQLTYSSPYFKFGRMLTSLGLFVRILIFGLFAIKNRYTKYESIVTLKKGRKDFEQKEKFKYDDCEK